MKECWEYKKLGDFCRKGKNIKWDDQTNDTSFRYIDLTSVDRNDLCIHNPQIITKDNAPSRAKQIIQAGDIIFATTRPTLRRVSLIDEQYDGDICSTGFCVLRPNKEVKSKIIFYALLNDSFYKYIEPLQTGANYPAVTDSIVKNYIIPVPPLSEQQRIVDYLDSAFAKIDAMKANAEKALNEAKALFQASLKEMLEPKEGWEEKTLKELGQTQTGTTPSKSDKDNYGDYIPFIRPSEIDYDGSGRIEYNSALKLSKKGADNGRVFDAHSIYMVCIGATIGKVGYGERAISCNQQINIFSPNSSVNYKFAYYAMKNDGFQQKVIKEGTSSQATLPIINKGKWEKLSLSYPPLSEQQSIVASLDSLKSKVDQLQENYDKISQECDALKQAILRQVFE